MAIDRSQAIGPAVAPGRTGASTGPRPAAAPGFQEALSRAGGLQFSNHAQKRIDRRELEMGPARLQRLESAVSAAAEKGGRNSLVMLDGMAVVVDVRGRTVVTALNASEGKERVFTNIDSVVIA